MNAQSHGTKMNPKLVIWDWNGTLLDDNFLTYSIANEMRAWRNMPPLESEDAYREVFGFPIRDYYIRMGYTFEDESYETVSDQYIKLYNERVASCTLRQGIVEAVELINSAGIEQVILSASQKHDLVQQVALFGLEGKFERVMGLDDHFAHSKAALAADFMRSHSIDPRDALFVGDTEHDREVSLAINCPCVLLTGGHQTRAQLERTGAPVFDTVEELLNYIGL